MLTFSKERQPVMKVASLNQTVGEVCELMQARAADCRVRLEVRLMDELPTATYDPEGIHRAVLNVVTNAIDAVVEGDPPRRVTVATRHIRERSLVEIEVRDTGAGIAVDQMDKLFSPFVSTKKSHGTGLGLPVSQKILAEHGGKITVESSPGQGACFTLEFPAVSPASTTQIVNAPTG